MKNKVTELSDASFRKFYGKLFSALLSRYGANYINHIEDAIQNAFYKSLKSWKPDLLPEKPENWLFIVAKNDLLNQIKKSNRKDDFSDFNLGEVEDTPDDLRLKTILFVTKSNKITTKAKALFILKNIFGLHVKEISYCTLIGEDAIYKSIKRTGNSLKRTSKTHELNSVLGKLEKEDVAIVEEILYAVFNIGFDSFNEKKESIVNEDLCLEALSLTKFLLKISKIESTKNLLALMCFNIARISEKVKDGKLVSFFEQDKTNWNSQFITLGFHYMEKPEKLNPYYIEALITSKHMTATDYDQSHWNDIIGLYQLLIQYKGSPYIRLNMCYCLSKAKRTEEAMELLDQLEEELPKGHVYFSLVKANILDSKTKESQKLIEQALGQVKQDIRKKYILENLITNH